MSEYFEPILSIYQCGFRKDHSAQHCLLVMVKKWKKYLDHKGTCGALLTDLSKSFACLPRKLLLDKFNAYGFDESSLNYIEGYLSDQKQRVINNNSFSNWAINYYSVQQVSNLCPLLFICFAQDNSFVFNKKSYAEDNTADAMNKLSNQVLRDIKMASEWLFTWF